MMTMDEELFILKMVRKKVKPRNQGSSID